MRRTHTLVNDVHDDLEVWIEPWADLYVIPRGAKVVFSYTVEGETDLLESVVGHRRLTFWFRGAAPDVTIDGAEAEPVDQYEWRARSQERHC